MGAGEMGAQEADAGEELEVGQQAQGEEGAAEGAGVTPDGDGFEGFGGGGHGVRSPRST